MGAPCRMMVRRHRLTRWTAYPHQAPRQAQSMTNLRRSAHAATRRRQPRNHVASGESDLLQDCPGRNTGHEQRSCRKDADARLFTSLSADGRHSTIGRHTILRKRPKHRQASRPGAIAMRPNPFPLHCPRVSAKRILGMAGAVAALASVVTAAAGSAAEARECRKNYYKCSLNRGGRIDPANPDCCWQPLAGPPSRACAPGFYRCDLNAGGRIDPRHPDCCWSGR